MFFIIFFQNGTKATLEQIVRDLWNELVCQVNSFLWIHTSVCVPWQAWYLQSMHVLLVSEPGNKNYNMEISSQQEELLVITLEFKTSQWMLILTFFHSICYTQLNENTYYYRLETKSFATTNLWCNRKFHFYKCQPIKILYKQELHTINTGTHEEPKNKTFKKLYSI